MADQDIDFMNQMSDEQLEYIQRTMAGEKEYQED